MGLLGVRRRAIENFLRYIAADLHGDWMCEEQKHSTGSDIELCRIVYPETIDHTEGGRSR
jgi:hypothetical protein